MSESDNKKAKLNANFSTAEAAEKWVQKIGATFRGATVLAKNVIGTTVTVTLEAVGSILTAAMGALKDFLPFSIWGTCSIKPV